MVTLARILESHGQADFEAVLKQEIERLDPATLPLQQALTLGSRVADTAFSVMLLGVADEGGTLQVKIGIIFSGIDAGCSCADDPTPINENTEYCEMLVHIDKRTGAAAFQLLPADPG